ncbi:unnamed protein product [Orchesella dallaii]|uniref:CRAL/TRIO N-terminal domain-containing protein n=1 Tax=Orchesella dallaii TaxID=48710 RepID=A0ABP1Q4S3_9HEXA
MEGCSLFVILLLGIGCGQLVAGISVEKDLSLTLSQKNALDKFRAQVEPLLDQSYMKNDIYLIRWLRARNFDLRSAENMLRENLKWRREQKIDGIRKEDWNDMRRDYHATIDTYDKEGRPIGVIDIYDWDIRRAVLQGKGQRLLRYMDYLLESITTQVFERQDRGMNVTQWKVLGNADGFNLIEHGCPLCIPLWIQFIQGLENHYHGWLDELIVIDGKNKFYIRPMS